MPGSPKKRAKREAAAKAASGDQTTSESGAPKGAEGQSMDSSRAAQTPRQRPGSGAKPRGASKASAKDSATVAQSVEQPTGDDVASGSDAGSSPARRAQHRTPAPQTETVSQRESDSAAAPGGNVVRISAAPRTRAPARTRTREAAPAKSVGTQSANLDARQGEIIDWLAEGMWPTAIGKKLKVTARTLIEWIEADEGRARACTRAREMAAMAKLEEAERLLRSAKDMKQLAKAREMAHHLRWLAARLDGRKFGDKLDLTSGGEKLPRSQAEIDKELADLLAKHKRA